MKVYQIGGNKNMKCKHCGYDSPEDIFICPKCRKFADEELNLIDSIDRAVYDYKNNPKKQVVERTPNYGKYHVNTYTTKKKKPQKKSHPFLITAIIIIMLFLIFKFFIL